MHAIVPCWLAGSVFSYLGLICRESLLHRTSNGQRRGRREGERGEGGREREGGREGEEGEEGEREKREGERGGNG